MASKSLARLLVEGGRDQAREANEVGIHFPGLLQNLRRGHHDPEVDDLKVVTLERDPNELLARAKTQITRMERFLRSGTRHDIAGVIPVNPSTFYWNGAEAIKNF